MKSNVPKLPQSQNIAPHDLPRRRFVQGLAAGGVLMGMSPMMRQAQAADSGTTTGSAPILSGTEFDLVVEETPVNFTGAVRMATTINGSLPSPTLRWREGDTVTMRVTNKLKESTSIHWHGIILPYQMDGVPGVSFNGIPPGETFVYRFKVGQAGTYWYHSHSGFQEQTGMYGTIIIDGLEERTDVAERDYVIQVSDWTDDDPMKVFARLKKQGDYYNFNQPTAVDFFRDVSTEGLLSAFSKRRMWNQMRMNQTDLADISGHGGNGYTYLMNGTTPRGNWNGLFKPGERVRLRFVNGATQSYFDVRIPGLKMTVVQSDGLPVEPVTIDEFRFGPGETYDVIVTPTKDAYTVFAQSMDRSGYARGTLATRSGMQADVPEMDKPEPLTMTDMMGDMSAGGMDHGDMAGGDMASMNHNSMGGGDMADMNHAGHAMAAAKAKPRHASTEYGPSVDARVNTPRTNLDDPGVGLRNNGRKVLTYADLRSAHPLEDQREPDREIELHLTGNMERYTWSIDGLEYGKSTPIHFRYGERLRVILHNDTMMTHPMHLHGMWSDLENEKGEFTVRRHTVSVQPAQRVSFLVTVDAMGRWAWHCHLLYHMDAGMFREVVVA